MRRFVSIVKRHFSQKVQGFVGVSRFVTELHVSQAFFKNAFHRTIYNAVDIPSEGSYLVKNDGPFTLGFLGRIDSYKGADLLARAVAKLEKRDVKLIYAGTGDSKYIETLSVLLKGVVVEFIGYSSPSTLFQKIDFLVVPSTWREPFGRVVIEANSYGVPVLGARSGGIPEIIIEGKTGFLFDAGEVESLVEAISKAKSAGLEQMRVNAREHSKSFENKIIAEQYLDAYRAAIMLNN